MGVSDDLKETYIRIKHLDNSIIYKVNNNAVKIAKRIDPTNINIINIGSEKSMIFIIKYLNYYSTNEEIIAPEKPSEIQSLIELFELEVNIFGELLNIHNIEQNKYFVNELINIALKLDMPILVDKLHDIMAYYMMSINNI